MSTADGQDELDGRFPSGEWRGFYVQPDSRRRYGMDLHLKFAEHKISGTGADPIGEFVIRGTYDTATGKCWWTKQYIGQHCVKYTGQGRGGGIIGQWRIPGNPAFWSGPFFIWPRGFGDLEAAFEKAFLEYELTAPGVGSRPELVEV